MQTKKYSFGKVSNVDLRMLRIFATIVEQGGFSEAQVELNAAPSTVSTYMANLEKRLGLSLCTRGRRGFRMTDRGRVIFEETEKLFRALDEFESAVAATRGQLAGEVRIGIVDNSTLDPTIRIPRAILRFTGRHPQAHLSVEVMSPIEVEEAMLNGKLDIGIAVFHRRKPGIEYLASFSEMLDLYCGTDHPLFERAPNGISPTELAEASYARGVYLPTLPRNAQTYLAEPKATTYQAEGLAFLILSGRYIGFLPRRYCAIWVERGWMRPLLPDTFSREAPFGVIARRGAEPTPIVRAFLEELGGEMLVDKTS